VSTVGWLPGLTRFVDEVSEPIRLALSLHAPADALRSELMPVNDRIEHAKALTELLDRHLFKVNLIPYNPTGMYDGSSRDAIATFKAVLDKARLPSTVRLTRGRDIAAACGQLAATA
jgi:23S rRNA (adenine2503-C2)-methyltransferase